MDNFSTDTAIADEPTPGKKPTWISFLKLIHKYQPLSRSDITRRLGCHSTTTNRFIDELTELGWLSEQAGRIPKGRRPINIVLNPAVCFAGLHVAADGFYCVVADARGEVQWSDFMAIDGFSQESLMAALEDLRARMTAAIMPGNENAPLETRLKGLGICASGTGLRRLLLKFAERVFNAYVVVEAPAIAYGHYFLHSNPGAAQARGHLVTLYANAALELGVLVNGVPLRGANDEAGATPYPTDAKHATLHDEILRRIGFAIAAYDPGLVVLWGAGAAQAGGSNLLAWLTDNGVPEGLVKIETDTPGARAESRASVDVIINYLFN